MFVEKGESRSPWPKLLTILPVVRRLSFPQFMFTFREIVTVRSNTMLEGNSSGTCLKWYKLHQIFNWDDSIEIRFISDQPEPLPVDRHQSIVENNIFNTYDFMPQIHDVQLDLVCESV
jgi:hypothetical protein